MEDKPQQVEATNGVSAELVHELAFLTAESHRINAAIERVMELLKAQGVDYPLPPPSLPTNH